MSEFETTLIFEFKKGNEIHSRVF